MDYRDVSSRRVFEIPGEPAIVINGLPDISPVSPAQRAPGDGLTDQSDKGFSEWLEGREVTKLFGTKYYSGLVTKFDREAGWYRVVYKDGDSEDLDWTELREVLQPLDVMVPLKALVLKTLRRGHRAARNVAGSRPKATGDDRPCLDKDDTKFLDS